MRISIAVLFLSLPALTGCAAMRVAVQPGQSRALGLEASVLTVATAMGGEAPAPAADDVAVEAAPQGGKRIRLIEVDLSIWNDPKFKKRFAESYLSLTDIEPPVTLDERDTMLEVLELIAADKLEEAGRLVDKQRGPGASAVFDFTLANIYYQRDDFDQAAITYRVAVDKFPNFRRAWAMLGQIHYRQGRFADAIGAFTRVIALGGAEAITYGLLGLAHSKLGDHVSAESALRMAAMLDPNTQDWKIGLAGSFFQQGRFADAASLFDGLIAAQPERAVLWIEQGKAYAMLGKPLDAAANFEFADRLGGATVASLENLGDIYANEQLYGMAVHAYLRALNKTDTASPDRALRAANHLVRNGALAETRELVDGIESIAAERLDEDDRKDILHVRARLAIAEGAGDEQIEVLQRIVALDPRDGNALILLGQHAFRSGEPERAVLYYQRAAAIEAFEAEAKLRHGEILVKQGKFAEALPLLVRAQDLKPRDHVKKYIEQVERRARSAK